MDDTGNAVVLITAGSEDEAKRIQLVLLTERLAACVSVLRGMNSMYWWRGKLETADEILLIAKTRTSQIGEIVNLVKQNHSYSVPEIIVLPVVGGNSDYLAWVDREATGSRGGSEKDVERRGSTEV
jgi:periplasmic divalent cation tolerance protein